METEPQNTPEEVFRVAFVESAVEFEDIGKSNEIAKRLGRDKLPCDFLSTVPGNEPSSC